MFITRILHIAVFSIFLLCANAYAAQPQVYGHVLDKEFLVKGGTLGLRSLRAGNNASADDQLDTVSMMVLKGVSESLVNQKSVLKIPEANQQSFDCVLDGYVQEISGPGKMSRLFLRKSKGNLAIEGEIWRTDTQERVLQFNASVVLNVKKDKIENKAYELGLALGNYIAQAVQLEETVK